MVEVSTVQSRSLHQTGGLQGRTDRCRHAGTRSNGADTHSGGWGWGVGVGVGWLCDVHMHV